MPVDSTTPQDDHFAALQVDEVRSWIPAAAADPGGIATVSTQPALMLMGPPPEPLNGAGTRAPAHRLDQAASS